MRMKMMQPAMKKSVIRAERLPNLILGCSESALFSCCRLGSLACLAYNSRKLICYVENFASSNL